MTNNDILIRLRYALDLRDYEMTHIFKLGGVDVTLEDVKRILTNEKDITDDETDSNEESDDILKVNDIKLESFLNGFIIFKRGKQKPQPGKPEGPTHLLKGDEKVNNVLLKKLKIALTLTSEDMHEIFELAGITVSKPELSAVFRKAGHKNYKECGDRYARNFLKGLAVKYRG